MTAAKSQRAAPSDAKDIAPASAGAAKLRMRPAFATKKQPPSADDLLTALEPADSKRLESTRSFLQRHKGVTEDVFFYGPQAGWGLRYLVEGAPLCALLVCGQKPFAVVALPAESRGRVDWAEVSAATQAAKQEAEIKADPSSGAAWIDLLLNAKGQSDLRLLVKARLTYRS